MKKVVAVLMIILLTLPWFNACQRRESPGEEGGQRSGEPPAVMGPSYEERLSEPEPESSDEEDEVDAEGAESAARGLFDALKTGNPDIIREHIDYKNLLQLQDDQSDGNLLALLPYLQYEIIEVSAQKQTAIVQVRVSNVDMHAVMPEFLRKAMEMEYNNALEENPLSTEAMDEEYRKLFGQLLEQNAANRKETAVDVQLLFSGDQWRAQSDETLRTAVSGDYWGASKQVQENAVG